MGRRRKAQNHGCMSPNELPPLPASKSIRSRGGVLRTKQNQAAHLKGRSGQPRGLGRAGQVPEMPPVWLPTTREQTAEREERGRDRKRKTPVQERCVWREAS